jgi:hypothetical protein
MSEHRSALLLHTLFLHAFVLVVATANAAPAASKDECVAKPNKSVSAGEHWYYRQDRVNNRRCWYVGQTADRQQRSSTRGASLNAPDAPEPQKPAASPIARPSPSVKAALRAEPGQETTILSAPPDATAPADELSGLSRSSVMSGAREAAAEFSVAPAPTESVALGSHGTAPTAAPVQPAAGIAQVTAPAPPPSALPAKPAAASAWADIARPLTALALAALALLLMAKPISQLGR